ncbi:MAG: hypothetical protein IJQ95_06170 [Paludibacteraceae bacterium]|nr:hypothetical protein [Paludibacteraceae bacterium]
MRKWLVIVGMVFVVSALTGWVLADDIDDVYYWPDNTPVPARQVTPTTTTTSQPVQTDRITYIEDSVTMHSDTIVKAIIRR